MAKNFLDSINESKENKKIKNLQSELDNIRGHLTTARDKIKHYEEIIRQEDNDQDSSYIDLSDIKPLRNLRENYYYENVHSLAGDLLENGQIQALTLTKDNYLIAGYRRYNAFKILSEKNNYKKPIRVIRLDETLEELGDETFDRLQVLENERRKSLDNFHLSKLFNKYLNSGYSNKEIASLFDRDETTVSRIAKIISIDISIKKMLLDIQYFGVSKAKFNALNLTSKDIKPSTIGLNVLYKIAQLETKEAQIKLFIKKFKSKLTKEELISLGYKEQTKPVNFDRTIKSINTDLDKLIKSNPDKKALVNQAKKEIKEILKRLES